MREAVLSQLRSMRSRPALAELAQLSVHDQWATISARPALHRACYTVFCVLDYAIVSVVYVWGWRTVGASVQLLIPVVLYLFLCATKCSFVTIYGPSSKATALGPVLGMLQMFHVLVPTFLPVHKKPFSSTVVHLVAVCLDIFLTNFLATSCIEVIKPSEERLLTVVDDVILGGLVSAIRRLDSVTDLEVGYIILSEAQSLACQTPSTALKCGLLWRLAVVQLTLAALDFVIASVLQFAAKMLSASGSHLRRVNIAVRLVSAGCEVGMLTVYGLHLNANHDLTSDGGDGGAVSADGRSAHDAALYVAFSVILTLGTFAATVVGLRRIFAAVRHAARSVRQHVSAALSRTSIHSVHAAHGTRRSQVAPRSAACMGEPCHATLPCAGDGVECHGSDHLVVAPGAKVAGLAGLHDGKAMVSVCFTETDGTHA